ncbi:hypothetical protein B0H10DRAFT_1970369 [Mycena sp. CBHHK59/15]|nr:hypothetical protein B0H10DRAFT_1970369 [Mycena sp. CBHHK59/15]
MSMLWEICVCFVRALCWCLESHTAYWVSCPANGRRQCTRGRATLVHAHAKVAVENGTPIASCMGIRQAGGGERVQMAKEDALAMDERFWHVPKLSGMLISQLFQWNVCPPKTRAHGTYDRALGECRVSWGNKVARHVRCEVRGSTTAFCALVNMGHVDVMGLGRPVMYYGIARGGNAPPEFVLC